MRARHDNARAEGRAAPQALSSISQDHGRTP